MTHISAKLGKFLQERLRVTSPRAIGPTVSRRSILDPVQYTWTAEGSTRGPVEPRYVGSPAHRAVHPSEWVTHDMYGYGHLTSPVELGWTCVMDNPPYVEAVSPSCLTV